MNKLILCTVLMLISLQGKLLAQTPTAEAEQSKTQKTFNPCKACYIHIKDFVYLKDASMKLDLFRIQDYDLLTNIDSILMNFRKDVAFYKDSLDGDYTGNVRIDYVLNLENSTRKIRFKKYPVDGQSFVKRNGDVSKLKIEQDTVHIVVETSMPLDKPRVINVHGEGRKLLTAFPYSIQATFALNNYTDVDRLIADKIELKRIIDTLHQAKQHLVHGSPGYIRATSSIYKPYATSPVPGSKFKTYREFAGIIKNDHDKELEKNTDYLTVDLNMGMGLIRNTFAPSADLGLMVIRSWRRFNQIKENNFYGLYFQPIFFFDKNSKGDYITNTNGFVNFHYGAEYDNDYFGLKLKKASFGVGYLVLSKGDYFKKNTFKVFMDMQLRQGITVSPELIMTDNFKQVFPGITVKVF